MQKQKEYSDQNLVKHLRAGKVSAFNQLFFQYSPRLIGFVRNFYHENWQVEEVVQEVFLKVWEKRAELDEKQSLQSFLFTIAKNIVYSQLRSRYREEQRIRDLQRSNFSNSTEDTVIWHNLQDFHQTIIDSLPEKQKEIFQLSRFEGLSNDEISVHLGISKRTVENQLYKSLKTIRKHFEKEHILFAIMLILLLIF